MCFEWVGFFFEILDSLAQTFKRELCRLKPKSLIYWNGNLNRI